MDAILALLGSRSYGSLWFWVVLTGVWTMAGRNVLGVPPEIFTRIGAGDQGASLRLLDWLSLQLPRWRISSTEISLMLGLAGFAFSLLALLGFAYQLELAQALFLLGFPFALLTGARLHLASKLNRTLQAAQMRTLSTEAAAHQAAGLMRRHRGLVFALSVVSVAVTAFLGALWMVRHPYGF